MKWVIDASVAAKWLAPEPDTPLADLADDVDDARTHALLLRHRARRVRTLLAGWCRLAFYLEEFCRERLSSTACWRWINPHWRGQ